MINSLFHEFLVTPEGYFIGLKQVLFSFEMEMIILWEVRVDQNICELGKLRKPKKYGWDI